MWLKPVVKGPLEALLLVLILAFSLLSFLSNPVNASTEYYASETKDNLVVTWYLNKVAPFSYNISVQNLLAFKREVSLTTIFEKLSHSIDELIDVAFFEWKNVSHNVQVPVHENVTYPNGTRQEVSGYTTETRYRLDWKPCKMQSFKKTATTYNENMGKILIPKYDSKPKDATVNGTKWFRLDFTVPFKRIGNDWGMSGLVALTLDANRFDPWYNASWTYRLTHEIVNATGAGANYQVKIIVVNGSSSNSGNTVYIDNKTESGFGDIRFTDNDGETLLDYWMEELNSAENATFWVEVADSLSTANATIYMYYGSSGASTTSDGEETFLLFDDFPGVALNTSKWDVIAGAVTVADSELELTGIASPRGLIESKTTISQGAALHTRVKWSGVQAKSAHFCSMRASGDWYNGTSMYGMATNNVVRTRTGDGTLDESGDLTITAQTSYDLYKSTWESGEVKFYKNTTLLSTHTSNVPTIDLEGMFCEAATVGHNVDVDWILIRTWVNPEPVHGVWGSEEEDNNDPTIGDFRAEILLDSADLSGSSVYLHYAATSIGQAFKPKANGTLTTAQLYLNKKGSPTGTAYVELYSTTGTYGTDATPTGSVLATSEGFDVSTLAAGTYAWKTFVFNSTEQYSIVKDTAYFLVFNQSTCTIAYWDCVVTYKGTDKSNGAEHDGNFATYHMIGSDPWAGDDGYDLDFMVYGNVSSPTLYANELCFIQATINDADGVAEFVNATVALNQSIILKWANTTDTYSEYQDTNNFCTLVTPTPSPTITVNASAYTLKWHVKINNYDLATSDLLAADTKVYDTNDASGSGSTTGLFTYNQGYYITWDMKDTSTETRIPDATTMKINSGNGTTITDNSATGLHSDVRVSAGSISVLNAWWGEYVTVPTISWYVNENETFTDLSPVRRISSGDYYLLIAGNFTDIGDDPERTSGSGWKIDNAHLRHVVVYDTRTVIVNLSQWLTTSEPYKIIMYGNDYVRGSDMWSYSDNAVVIDVFKLLGSGGDWTGYLEMTWGEPAGPTHGSVYIPPEPEEDYVEEVVEEVQEVAEETQKGITTFLGESPYPGMLILVGIVAVVFLYGKNTVQRKSWRKKGKSPTRRRKKAKPIKWRENQKFKG